MTVLVPIAVHRGIRTRLDAAGCADAEFSVGKSVIAKRPTRTMRDLADGPPCVADEQRCKTCAFDREIRGTSIAASRIMRTHLAFIALAGCAGFDSPRREEELVDQAVAIRGRMHVRFAAATTARDAIESGDLEQARAAGRMIEALDEPEIRAEWQPYVANVRRAAGDLVVAQDLSLAGRRLATIGERCADCHVASHTRVLVGTSTAPKRSLHLEGEMGAHYWAVGRMWDGLLSASEQTWLTGAQTLETARLTIVAEGEVPGHELGIAGDVARVRLLARRASRARTNHDRAELYGELLSTCVSCHHAIRDR